MSHADNVSGLAARACLERAERRSVLPRCVVALLGGLVAVCWASVGAAANAELAWDQVVDATGYRVYYDTDSGAPYEGTQANEGASPLEYLVANLADPANPTVTITGLPSCTELFFAVTAFNDAGESAYSEEISAKLAYKPLDVTAGPQGQGALGITWSAVPDDDDGAVLRYYLHYDTTSHPEELTSSDPSPYAGDGSPVAVQTSALPDPENPSYKLTGLELGTTYYLRVRAACDADNGSYSDEASGESGDTGSGGSGEGGSGTGGGGTGNSGNTGGTGTGTATGTDTGTGASGADGDNSVDEGGCGCALPGRGAGRSLGALVSLVGLAGVAARRRRRA